jgi:hypothetical protein
VKDVSVRKVTLLEFDGIDARHMPAKDVVTPELLQQFLEFPAVSRVQNATDIEGFV